jgi:hypothetical protein
VEECLEVARVGGAVGDDAKELEGQHLAQVTEVVQRVALGEDTVPALWEFVHLADDIELPMVLEEQEEEGACKDVVED